MENIWADPVWSKVIAAGIIAIAGFALRLFWNKLPPAKKKQIPPITMTDSTVHPLIEISQALMQIDVDPAMLKVRLDDPDAYQTLLDQLCNEELITFSENNVPILTKKGQKLIKKKRKLDEKMND